MVKKKNGETRFCVDYRKLNQITKRDNYPLPRIDELLDDFGKAKWFSTLDLKSGYWQVEMDPADQAKTAFITRHGTYEYLVMPFGLTNAPATFQRLMNTVFANELHKFIAIYLDDLNIYSSSFEEHPQHLQHVFNLLRKAGLKLNTKKCFFGQQQLQFLGHIISENGIQPDNDKVDKVKNFPRPKNVSELRGFIGLASYYRRFIKDFATIAAPLHKLLKKDTLYQWNPACQEAFATLKHKLISAPILIYPDFEKEFILFTDASYSGLGTVLA